MDCVREQARKIPASRTAFGGVTRAGRPVVTFSIIGVCVALFLLQLVSPLITGSLLYAPYYTAGVPGIVEPEPWRMLTAAFLHSPNFLLHIAFNMYALWILGQSLEPMLGRARFFGLYLLSAVGGSVGVLLLASFNQGVVGASGAVFGLFGALFIIQRKTGGEVRQIVVLIAINGVLGFVVQGISWQAHLGGLLTGAAAAAVLAYAPKGSRRASLQWAGLAMVAVLLVLLTVVGVFLLPI